MRMGEWEDAERDLLEALGKDAKSADTLANLVTVRALAAAAAAVAGVVAATCSAFCTCHLLRVCMCPFFAVWGDLCVGASCMNMGLVVCICLLNPSDAADE